MFNSYLFFFWKKIFPKNFRFPSIPPPKAIYYRNKPLFPVVIRATFNGFVSGLTVIKPRSSWTSLGSLRLVEVDLNFCRISFNFFLKKKNGNRIYVKFKHGIPNIGTAAVKNSNSCRYESPCWKLTGKCRLSNESMAHFPSRNSSGSSTGANGGPFGTINHFFYAKFQNKIFFYFVKFPILRKKIFKVFRKISPGPFFSIFL